MYLHEKLEEYEKNGRYPMHMPGHKRQLHEKTYESDITEIEGFDDLHHSEDILKSDREKAAEFYGAGEARFLVNGSTCGVLAAISAVTEYGDTIVIGRNSHKSAYHAIQLRGLRAEYVYPDASLYENWSIDGPILPEAVLGLLEETGSKEQSCKNRMEPMRTEYLNEGRILPAQSFQKKAVFITSPTYEGVISNVKEIARICHEHGVPLIVDEAHGAHLKVMGAEGDALEAGADIVILGLHKTMPVLTQAALLAVSREAIHEGRVSMKILDEYLGIYESSSPSYVLMGSISRCIHWLDGSCEIGGKNKKESVDAYQKFLGETRGRLLSMKHFRLFPEGERAERRGEEEDASGRDSKAVHVLEKKDISNGISYDPGKLVISTKGTGITGQELAERLRNMYRIEIEMASADYIIAMTSMFDTEEGMRSFADAVLSCDEMLEERQNAEFGAGGEAAEKRIMSGDFPKAKVVMPIAEAVSYARQHSEKVREMDILFWLNQEANQKKDIERDITSRLSQGANQKKEKERDILSRPNQKKEKEKDISSRMNQEEEMISTEFVYVYPPGIPIIAPGEIITKVVAKKIVCDYNSGCALIGCGEREGKVTLNYVMI